MFTAPSLAPSQQASIICKHTEELNLYRLKPTVTSKWRITGKYFEKPRSHYKLANRHIWIAVPKMLYKLVMFRLYINLHSYENQPNDA